MEKNGKEWKRMENTMRHLKVHYINRFKSDNGKHRSDLPTLQRTLKSLQALVPGCGI